MKGKTRLFPNTFTTDEDLGIVMPILADGNPFEDTQINADELTEELPI